MPVMAAQDRYHISHCFFIKWHMGTFAIMHTIPILVLQSKKCGDYYYVAITGVLYPPGTPGMIPFTPMTTELVGGNIIV